MYIKISYMTDYNKTSLAVFGNRFHVVWITKCLYKVLEDNLRVRNITDDIINNYINNHSDAHQSNQVISL